MLGKVQATLMPPEEDEPPHCAGDGYRRPAALGGTLRGKAREATAGKVSLMPELWPQGWKWGVGW